MTFYLYEAAMAFYCIFINCALKFGFFYEVFHLAAKNF